LSSSFVSLARSPALHSRMAAPSTATAAVEWPTRSRAYDAELDRARGAALQPTALHPLLTKAEFQLLAAAASTAAPQSASETAPLAATATTSSGAAIMVVVMLMTKMRTEASDHAIDRS
jgi:hypothetical protein